MEALAEYFVGNPSIAPALTFALKQLCTERPSNPVDFLAHQLLEFHSSGGAVAEHSLYVWSHARCGADVRCA